MAIDFSKWNFFSRLDARARVAFILGVVIVFVLVVYFATRYFSGSDSPAGSSKVAQAPQGLESVPGGQLTPEYYRALMQANSQATQQAQISGGSAVPTLVNVSGQSNGNCSVLCTDQSANVKYTLDDLVKQGKLSPEAANTLQQLADKNVSVDEYANALNDLVKQGKLSPEAARQLLEQYRKQHSNALLDQSAKSMDDLIKSGALPLESANELLQAQKNKLTPAEYAALLDRMVKEGKISPATAQRLLAQYTQQQAQEAAKTNVARIQQMAHQGQLTPDLAKQLSDLANRNVSLDDYNDALQKAIAAGKLTPAVAAKLLDEYKKQKNSAGSGSTLTALLNQAEADAYNEIRDLLAAKQISPEVAGQLRDMIQNDVPLETFKNTVNQMVQQNRLTPEISRLKIADYVKVKGLRDLAKQLNQMQARNANTADYTNALKAAVKNGLMTPQQAAKLLEELQMLNGQGAAALPLTAIPGATDFNRLQQSVQQDSTPAANVDPNTFSAAEEAAQEAMLRDRQARIQALLGAMSGQAQQLVAAWQPAQMEGKARADSGALDLTNKDATGSAPSNGNAGTALTGPTLIKAGTIIFAVLDTEANSDYPDSPIMATIVDGKYKGAKLLGRLVTAKNPAGQLDRISLNFTMMNTDEWDRSKAITAYAIDPDTARSVMASHVNYHYMLRFGAVMATSFLQGYANAITNVGTTVVSPSGTTTTRQQLDPRDKIAAGLGQVGQTLGSLTQNYINVPPTVRVASGVGLGILFMADVT